MDFSSHQHRSTDLSPSGIKNDRQTRAGSKPEMHELHFQRLKSEYLRWILQTYKLHTKLSEGKLPQLLPRTYIVLRGWHSSGVWRSFQSSDSSHTAWSGLGSGACPQYGETQRGCLKQKKKQPETNLLLRPYYRQQMHPRGQSSHCTNRPRLVAIPQCPLIKLLQIRSPLDNQAAVGDSLKRGSEALYLTTWTLCLATPVLRLAEEM